MSHDSSIRVLAVEGTAWAASAAVYDAGSGDVFIETDAYLPDSGGIHPREAAEHMHGAIPRVVETALSHARETVDGPASEPPVDAVAFSRGPGLGPCLRIVATAARALAQTLEVPLVGVNHMVAHLEIGRHTSEFNSPVCLNASGANAHLLAYRNGRYRVLGETMDTGVGNAIDKFTRHVGWSHPGGPKVEEAAARAEGEELLDLPYVVKGMDFSFSGIMTAAKEAYDGGEDVEDVCCSLQENVFAMLAEVAERALSLTGREELVLGGGVGQNARLRGMLAEMCEARGASFHAPDPRFLRDNAGMIAVLGAKMYAAGDTLEIADSRVDPDFRPDQVPVTWREAPEPAPRRAEGEAVRGAEAVVTPEGDRVVKRRLPKSYRHPDLDDRLRRERTAGEARLTSLARREGVSTPVLSDVDPREATLEFERVGTADLRDALTEQRVREVGAHLATIHGAGFVHGDPTTRNVRVGAGTDGDGDDAGGRTYLIDFGLGYHTDHVEDYAMDLHVAEGSLVGTADDPDPLRATLRESYRAAGDERVLNRLAEIESRGRYVSEP
ncbi:bifunctional N(6)-L-threonylcarbamoyladenine synthase/serine/threonine protein kinase [Saliphagus sp. LR7]|uniref:bifunctional N(6)-L-threonylcarbamoyladenine synthase/serine/threonine protein kinase n=1 Tax=Saliphagus sp. LR7 TaxID=2282654 RepID=UPI000DF743D7|nr:bifunctional N(6)-L-threonylcarbamoyladenine synthase/serine/threonine protein kinase [Saliphagus sp. LR7]